MVKIRIKVPNDRSRAGLVAITEGFRTLIEDTAVATSGIVSASDRVSGGHPPLGRYALAARAPTPSDAQMEYGNELLLFEPIAGQALEAESYGRFGVLLYAGPAGQDELLRRTQGGVRLSGRAMRVLLARIDDPLDVELEIEPLIPAPWWAFWRTVQTPPVLSRDAPRRMMPPYDEATLASELARLAIRTEKPRRRDTEPDDDRWRDRESPSTSSRDHGADYRGGGGSGGGGGASGAWSELPAGGRGPGVSAAGIIAGAAGAAMVAAAAESNARSGPSSETPESTAADAAAAAADSSESSGTAGNTAY